jgi:hypothetical protein
VGGGRIALGTTGFGTLSIGSSNKGDPNGKSWWDWGQCRKLE